MKTEPDEVIIDKTQAITVHVDEINFNDLMQMDQMFWLRVTDSISKMREGKNDDDPNS